MGVVYKQIGKDGSFEWDGVEVKRYQGGGASEGSSRRVLTGPKDGARNFSIRYFEIPPHGHSSFEHHLHDHGVFILQGRARVLLGWDVYEVGPGDVIYIQENEQHQFQNIDDGPLGFLCVNPSKEWLQKIEALKG